MNMVKRSVTLVVSLTQTLSLTPSSGVFADFHPEFHTPQVCTSRIAARMPQPQQLPCLPLPINPLLVHLYPQPRSSPLNLLTGPNTPLPLPLLPLPPPSLLEQSLIPMIHPSGVVREEEYVMVVEGKIVVRVVRRSIIESCIYLGVQSQRRSSLRIQVGREGRRD